MLNVYDEMQCLLQIQQYFRYFKCHTFVSNYCLEIRCVLKENITFYLVRNSL